MEEIPYVPRANATFNLLGYGAGREVINKDLSACRAAHSGVRFST